MLNFRSRLLLAGLAVLAIGCFLAAPAFSNNVDRQTLEIKLGGSDLVNTAAPFKRISIAAPDVADVVVLSPRSLYVYGKKVGYTSVILWEEGRGQTLLDVVISLDLTGLKK